MIYFWSGGPVQDRTGLPSLFKKSIIFCIAVILFSSCMGITEKTKSELRSVQITFKNMPVHTASVRINHIITGNEIVNMVAHKLCEPFRINLNEADMYIVTISWPRTFVSHRSYKRSKEQENGPGELLEVTKPVYIDKHTNKQLIAFNVTPNIEQLELEGTQNLHFQNADCKTCTIADEYWDIFSAFFRRKEKQIDSLTQLYYSAIDSFKIKDARAVYLKREELKLTYTKDNLMDNELKEKINKYPQSPISTFFLFYQLYNHREFEKFKHSFAQLEEEALVTPYYRMIKNQYKSR